jgi:hypothetical protein
MHDAGIRPAGAEFAELICADDQWLHQEFEALIAANYRPPAPPRPAPPRTPPIPPFHHLGRFSFAGNARGPGTGTSARNGMRRQRSPPSPWPIRSAG